MTKPSTFFFALFQITLCLIFSSHADAEVGELQTFSSTGERQSAILLSTHISGEVNGLLARISIDQNFRNDSDQWVNGRYVFPLPENAAVDGLVIQIGDRIIEGVIKEKAEAKRTFENAKKAGKKAGLLEQHRPNLFSISVANIAPHEEVTAKLRFIDRVKYSEDTFSLHLPTTITPRYIPGAEIKSQSELQHDLTQQFEKTNGIQTINTMGWANDTASVPDASAITPPQTYSASDQTNNLFSLALSLNAGIRLSSVTSGTHDIRQQNDISNQVSISLNNLQEPLDRDLAIEWKPLPGAEPKAAMFQEKFNDEYYTLLMVVPPSTDAGLSLPRDITFIIDSSGSMAGESMRQAKLALHEALTFLSPIDHFNIIDFDSSYRPLFGRSLPVSPEHIAQAKTMINQLDADGGTEMMGALEYALQDSTAGENSNSLQQIVFITDGAIGNENELYKLLKSKLGNARLFTVGIGSAPNTYFMNRAAKFGRGTYTYINDVVKVSTKMAVLFKRITHPLMRDLQIDWNQLNTEQYPKRIPDLYSGEPINVIVKSKKPIKRAALTGNMLEAQWQQKVILKKGEANSTNNLNTLWARHKVASIMDNMAGDRGSRELAKPEIIKLGLAHQIVTKFTSFVAVEKKISRPQGIQSKQKNIANLMPKGSTMPIPQTATPSGLLAVFGSFLLLISVVLRRRTPSSLIKGI